MKWDEKKVLVEVESDPKTIDAVLTYAMRGHGRRTNLYTDYTLPCGRAKNWSPSQSHSGLTDAEIKQVDQFVKQNTTDRFGPKYAKSRVGF